MQKVLITGGSEGIGYAFAEYYSSIGSEVFLVARNRMRLIDIKNALENTYHNAVHMICMDLSLQNSANTLYEQVKDENIDILINNAGCGYTERFWKIDIESEEKMVMLNDMTLMSLTKLFFLDMKKRHDGIILNVSSTGAFQPGPYIAGYYASKAFVASYTRAVYEEAKEYGVRIYCLLPGPVGTDFYRKSGVKAPLHAMKSEKVVAYTIKHMRKKCFIIPGVTNRIVRFLPESIRIYFIKKTKWRNIQKKRG